MAWIKTEPSFATRGSSHSGVAGPRALDRGSVAVSTQAFLRRVYAFMAGGLGITGLVALWVASNPKALSFVFGTPGVFMGLCIAELLLVVAFAPVAKRVSAGAAGAMLAAYSALNGVTLSVIFLRYTAGSIGSTFLITAGSFAALSAYGAVTKRDLTSLGSFTFMGLIGVVIASVVNIFLKSSMLMWLTTFAGILVFTGLAVYDTAKLKQIADEGLDDGASTTKLALQGALSLYLDFINLFLFMLRVLGRRRD